MPGCMPAELSAAAGAAASLAAAPAPEQPAASEDACTMRVLVQNTFIEVVAEGHSCARARRVHSAPAAPSPRTVEGMQAFQCDAAEAGIDATGRFGSPSGGENGAGPVDTRTTVVMRNLPPGYTRDLLLEQLDAHGFSGLYDFVYMPFEFGSGTNFGFAFVNLTGPEHAARFKAEFEGFSAWQEHCQREAAVGWSFTQGYQAHVDRFRNSPVMHEAMPDGCKPAVFENGVRVEFPPPTRRLPPLKRQRRRHNPVGLGGAPALAPPAARGGGPAPPAGLARESLLAAGLCPGAGPLGAPGGAAPSWADLSEDPECPDALEGLLVPALCPRQELPPRSPRRPALAPAAAACQDTRGADPRGGSSTDVSGARVLSDVSSPQEFSASSSQLSSASGSERADDARRGSRRGKRAGRRSAKSSANAPAWSAGSILLPGLVAFGALNEGPLSSIVDEHDAP